MSVSSSLLSKKTAQSANARTTVLHLTPFLNQAPYARSVVDLAVAINRRGWRSLIASSGGGLVVEAERAAVRHTRAPLHRHNIFVSWRNRVQIEALFLREKPALLHAHGIDVLALACRVGSAHKVPVLVDLTEPLPITKATKKLLRVASGLGVYFRVPSDFMAAHLRNDLDLQSPLLYKISPGIDLKWFDAARISAERLQDLANLWRLPETGTVFLTATPSAPGYGHKLLLDTLAEINRPDLYTVMIGASATPYGKEIEAMIHERGLAGRVVLQENCLDWPAGCWLGSVMIAVNGLARGQAQELLAAQALGRPVIATDCGANIEFAQSGETAWIIPSDDKAALKAAMLEAADLSMDQQLDLASRTRAFVEGRFSQTLWVDSLFELYGRIMNMPSYHAI